MVCMVAWSCLMLGVEVGACHDAQGYGAAKCCRSCADHAPTDHFGIRAKGRSSDDEQDTQHLRRGGPGRGAGRCPPPASSRQVAPARPPRPGRTVTIKAEGTDLSGKVKSPRAACKDDRKVIVFKQVGARGGGNDKRFASDTAESDGSWNTGNTGTAGRFYAKVRPTGGVQGRHQQDHPRHALTTDRSSARGVTACRAGVTRPLGARHAHRSETSSGSCWRGGGWRSGTSWPGCSPSS